MSLSLFYLLLSALSLILPCILPHPTFLSPSFSSSIHSPAPRPSLPPYPSLSSLSLSRRCHITPHALPFSLSSSLSLPSVCSLLSHSLRQLFAGCQFICRGRATTGFFQPWEQRGKGENGGKSGRRKSGGGQEGEEEEKRRRRRPFVKHPSLLSSLAAAASAPLPPPPLLPLDPLSPAGICLLLLLRELFLELGGGGRSPPPSLPRTLCEASGRKKEGRGGNFRRGRQESRGEATPWFTGKQRREEEKRVRGHHGTQSGPVVAVSPFIFIFPLLSPLVENF